MDLNIELLRNGIPYYEQIYEAVRDDIVSSVLKPGEKLPSTRSLADYLKVSRSTVITAYEQLQSEGYLTSRGGSGNYVQGIEDLAFLEPVKQNREVPVRTGQAPFYAMQHPVARPEEPGIIDFSPRRIDMSAFPYATWRRILRNLLVGERSDIFEMGDPQGDLPLRETIAHYLQLSRRVKCSAGNIILGAGNDYMLMLLGRILGGENRIGMENPTYPRAAMIFRALGNSVKAVRMDEAGLCVADPGTADCSILYVMPAHQYPMGITMPYSRRMELLQWAEQSDGRYIIEDDYDSEFRYSGKPLPSLQSADRSGKVLYLGTFSKSIAPAIRVSFLVLPDRLMQCYHDRCSYLSSTVSRMDQSLLEVFLDEGYFERYVNRMRNRYRAKEGQLLELLAPFGDRYRVTGQGAGLHVVLQERESGMKWDRGSTACREEELAARAEAAGVRVHPLSHLYLPDADIPAGQAITPSWLLGFAALTAEEIAEGVEKLRGVL